MPRATYGSKTIDYTVEHKDGLRAHYISVEKANGVVLRGKAVTSEMADKLILKKARWILEKLQLVRSIGEEDIVTGSRLPYIGRPWRYLRAA